MLRSEHTVRRHERKLDPSRVQMVNTPPRGSQNAQSLSPGWPEPVISRPHHQHLDHNRLEIVGIQRPRAVNEVHIMLTDDRGYYAEAPAHHVKRRRT
jgi:hypothetical protein